MSKIEKFVKACVSKFNILAIFTALMIAAGVVCMVLFGASVNATNDDVNTLTIKVNKFAYSQHVDAIEEVAENFFDTNDIEYEYNVSAEMYGDESELVYVFDNGVSVTSAMVDTLQSSFDALTATDSGNVLAGAAIKVVTNSEKSLAKLSTNGIIRAAIAATVFAVVACLYVAIRHHYTSGLTLFVSIVVSVLFTSALVFITRMPITDNWLFVWFFNVLFTAACTMFTLNKVRAAQKEDKKVDAETLVKSNLAVGQVLGFALASVVALIFVGAIATSSVRWFAAVSLLSVVAGVFASLFFAPALYFLLKKSADAKDAQRARYDYKKS